MRTDVFVSINPRICGNDQNWKQFLEKNVKFVKFVKFHIGSSTVSVVVIDVVVDPDQQIL